MFDEQGNWTEAGVATLGAYIQELETYKNAREQVAKELEDFANPYEGNEDYYAKLGIDSEQEYYDKLTELQNKQDDYTKSIKDSEQSIVEMYENQIDAIEEYTQELVDSYNDYIDVAKEALDAERDLYEFKKNIKKQTKDIAQLERRIASLSGSDNAADIAERRKLEAELYDQKENLNDTYYQNSKDAQSEALDNEAQAYEESMNKYVESLREKLDLAKEDMDSFIGGVTETLMTNAGTILEKYEETGITMSEDLKAPWKAAADAIGDFDKSEALALMNKWTQSGGAFFDFKVNASEQLTSVFETGKNAASEFGKSVKGVMDGVIKTIKDGVAQGSKDMSGLYEDIKYSDKNPSGGGNGGAGGNGGNNYKKGENVENLQKIMNQFFGAKLNTDGTYGPATKKAVSAMQKTLKLTSNGEYNTATYEALQTYLRQQGISEWFKSNGVYIPAAMYAKGTTGTPKDQWAITDEYGPELTLVPGKDGNLSFMRAGTGVIPADLTKNLMRWGQLNPSAMMGNKVAQPVIANVQNTNQTISVNFETLVKAEHIDNDVMPKLEKMVDKKISDFSRSVNYAIKKNR